MPMKMDNNTIVFWLTMILLIPTDFILGDGVNPGGNPSGQHGGGNPSGQHGGGNQSNQHGAGSGTSGSSGGQLTVFIGYAAFNKNSQAFFQSQFTSQVHEEFSKCNVDFKLYPCSTSKMVNGHLTCWGGETECNAVRIYACATKLNESNMKAVTNFVLCMHKANNQTCAGQNCATQSGLKWDDIQKCSTTPQADQYCQKYWDQANDDWQMSLIPGIMTPPKYNEGENGEAKANFKGYLCKKLKEKNMNCQACDSGSSTPSPGGGSSSPTPGGGSSSGSHGSGSSSPTPGGGSSSGSHGSGSSSPTPGGGGQGSCSGTGQSSQSSPSSGNPSGGHV